MINATIVVKSRIIIIPIACAFIGVGGIIFLNVFLIMFGLDLFLLPYL
jgi:hypothetical protein